jgi:urea carboxylase
VFRKVLVANRGEIACRVIRTLDRIGVASVAVFSDADAYAPHVSQAGQSVRIGAAPAADSYLRGERIIEAALETGAEAVHPGYGFLSENPDFAEACAAANVAFIGPTPDQMRAFGLKHRARALAEQAGVPLAPGSGLLADAGAAREAARAIGYPVMLKSTAGGGGIGLQLCRAEDEMDATFARVARLAGGNFASAGIFLEKYIAQGRHIEVQVFGDGRGRVVALGERDCSVQRRNQKIVEETPAPGLSDALRERLLGTAVRLCESVAYASAGTVEFMQDADGAFYFLEVNTRLQVEHGVTEEVFGVDLVEWMVRQAAGEMFDITPPAPRGVAIQARLYAEDPARGFRPSAGRLTRASFPADARVETWVEDGTEVTPFYDPLLAKVIATGHDRPAAMSALQGALQGVTLAGIETNLGYLRALVASPMFAEGAMTTRGLERFEHRPRTIEVLSPGTQTTVQDHPGRLGYWCVGVPPSGPMDDLSFRLANRALGNDPRAAALEMTIAGATIRFDAPITFCLAGAAMKADLNGRPIALLAPTQAQAGDVLRIGQVEGAGARTYLAFGGGVDVPEYLGSRATFTLGKFGGHGGRALLTGDVLHVGEPGEAPPPAPVAAPQISNDWEVGVLYGPHGAPDFFTDADIDAFFAAPWEVHYNSSRTGVRLIGPKPVWARADGGEAGLHPSNIHDVAYAIGAVDFTGDMPVILGPDGPSLGGFVCPAVVVRAELWKLGQLRAGDRVRFRRMTPAEAAQAEAAQDLLFDGSVAYDTTLAGPDAAVVASSPATGVRPAVVYRRAGDKNLLVEYGPPVLDIELRLRVHALMLEIERLAPPGVIDLTPGIRSLQVHHDSRVLPLTQLLVLLREAEERLPAPEDMDIPSRIVRLPLSWDDAATREAVSKYMQSVRADAPWCPSNIEFIRRVNGLDSVDDVRKIVFEASYLVLGLGDVYLGAPVATPVDPRQRLVTTKYNPARTWTPENAVGIGGAYLCVYGMEGPGGYQLFGRTCQMWNTYTQSFEGGEPWLLRFFDQIRFYPVSHEELASFRADLLHGRVAVDVTPATFSLREHRRFLAENADAITRAKARQQAAFEAERARWALTAQTEHEDHPEAPDDVSDVVPPGCVAVASPVSGSVWRVLTEPGAQVNAGDPLVVVESMKMELQVTALDAGTVEELRCAEGRPVGVGQTLIVIRPGGTE